MVFEYEDDTGYKSTYTAGVWYQSVEGVYKAEIRFDFNSEAATYTLVKVTYDDAKVAYNDTLSFTIKKEQTDFTGPTIEFVKLYHDGAEIEAGYANLTQEDTVEIRVGAKDEQYADFYFIFY